MRLFEKYYWRQWAEPKRFFVKGYGFAIWKWCGVYIPLITFYFGKVNRSIGYELFHNGVGLAVRIAPFFVLNLCFSGKIGWWYKKGLIWLRFLKWEIKY